MWIKICFSIAHFGLFCVFFMFFLRIFGLTKPFFCGLLNVERSLHLYFVRCELCVLGQLRQLWLPIGDHELMEENHGYA